MRPRPEAYSHKLLSPRYCCEVKRGDIGFHLSHFKVTPHIIQQPPSFPPKYHSLEGQTGCVNIAQEVRHPQTLDSRNLSITMPGLR